jgi:uncharacterized membrane protein
VHRHRRNLATLLWLEALVLALGALPLLLHDVALVGVFAALSAGLSLLAAPTREPRLRIAGLAPLVGAVAITLATLAKPRELFVETGHTWAGLVALALVLVAVAVAVLAPPATAGKPDRFDQGLTLAQPAFELVAVWTLALLALYMLSLGLLQVALSVGHRSQLRNFDIGRTALTGVWAVVGTALVIHAGSIRRLSLRLLGLVVLVCGVVDAVAFGAHRLPHGDWAAAVLVLVVACAVAGLVDGLRSRHDPEPAAAALLVVAGGLPVAAVAVVIGREQTRGLALLGLSLLAAALAAGVLVRRRNLATVLWVEALVLAFGALPLLLNGVTLVAAFATLSVATALLAVPAREPRLQLASLAPVLAAAAVTLTTLATPRHLFVETHRLWEGLIALALLLAALAGLLVVDRPVGPQHPDSFDDELARARPRFELVATWTLAVLALYTASIAVLQIVAWTGATYQSGQAAVSAVWSLIALAALTVGLIRDLSVVRLTGFAMIGVTLAKIFLYDLGSLSAVTRALSFLAVGGVLLASGFFYQRLAGNPES